MVRGGVILVVDGSAPLNAAIRDFLAGEGVHAVGVTSLRDARAYLNSLPVDGIILEYGLPDGSGGDLLLDLSLVVSPPPVLLASGHWAAEAAAEHFGVAYLARPFDLDSMLVAVRALLEGTGRPALRRRVDAVRVERIERGAKPVAACASVTLPDGRCFRVVRTTKLQTRQVYTLPDETSVGAFSIAQGRAHSSIPIACEVGRRWLRLCRRKGIEP